MATLLFEKIIFFVFIATIKLTRGVYGSGGNTPANLLRKSDA
jgi:hypothetical protein